MRALAAYPVFRALLAVAPHVPRGRGLHAAAGLGRLFGRRTAMRAAVRCNIRHVLPADSDSAAVERVVLEVFANQARNYFDMFHFAGRPASELASVTDWTSLRDHLPRLGGRGAIAVTMHYGNLDIVAQAIALGGVHVLAAVERLRPPALFDLVCAVRGRTGVELVPVDQAAPRMLRALRSETLVVLAADRDVTGTSVPADLFGATVWVPDGYARLAVLANVPILVVSSRRRADGTFLLRVERMHSPPRTAHRDAAVGDIVAAVLADFERVLADDPTQWVLFRSLWTAGDPSGGLTGHA